MNIDAELVAVLAVAGAAMGVCLVVAVIVLALRLRALTRRQRRVFAGNQRDVVAVLGEHADAIAELSDGLVASRLDVADVRERLRGAVSRVGLVRYDAFDDMGGVLSFSTALLDEHGDGVVISAINGRAETRCYAKPLVAGRSEHHLSAEEAEAVAEAVQERPTVLASPRRRGRRAS